MRKKKNDLSPDIVKQIVEWRVNTPALVGEIANNNSQMAFLRAGLQIFMGILYELGECASRINDPILNGMMCRLAIYEIADPYNKGFNQEQLDEVLRLYKEAKQKLKDESN